MMFVEEAVPQITPVACFSAWCGEPFAGVALFAALWAVLIAGALIMQRWRDMFLVAAVAWAGVFILETGREYVRHEFVPPLSEFPIWREFAFGYGMCLLWATGLHAIKRGVMWLAGYRAATA
jgi:hypothetical protein